MLQVSLLHQDHGHTWAACPVPLTESLGEFETPHEDRPRMLTALPLLSLVGCALMSVLGPLPRM